MALIREAILTTPAPGGGTHIAPLGFTREDSMVVLAPFAPSRTLEHLRSFGVAAISHTDDVRVYAGCLTGRRDWPLVPCEQVGCGRLADALSHHELRVVRIDDDPERPRFFCRELAVAMHRPFPGFNRAQAAVIEGCILVSRLHRIAPDRVARELANLEIAIDKTAGEREREAWGWLKQAVAEHGDRGRDPATASAPESGR